MKSCKKLFRHIFSSLEDFKAIGDAKIREQLVGFFLPNTKREIENLELAHQVVNELKREEHLRNGFPLFPDRMISNEEHGVWSLWDQTSKDRERSLSVIYPDVNTVARNPLLDVVTDGVIGIDFGTKSTVVSCREPGRRPYVLRIDTKDLTSDVSENDYENPTALCFRNWQCFKECYKARAGRPYTQWNDLTAAHAALNLDDFDTIGGLVKNLKQWVAGNIKTLDLHDNKGNQIRIKEYSALTEGDIDLVELYAYYIGLAVNSQQRGKIFLNYLISCPVSFSDELKKKLQKSFCKGLKKSLPESIFAQGSNCGSQFSVEIGASEPMAYAVAVLNSGIVKDDNIKDENDKILYGVFDFGGGTCDFNYGIYRGPNKEEQDIGYGRVVQDLDSGGDPLLGGENILECIAFNVYQENFSKMKQNGWRIAKPNQLEPFAGSEMFISNDSFDGRCNLSMIAEALRPIWEDGPDAKQIENQRIIRVRFLLSEDFSISKKVGITQGFELEVDVDKIKETIRDRIEKGVKKFKAKWKNVFKDDETGKRYIFLAGNSSRSKILQDVFHKQFPPEKYIIHSPVSNNNDAPINETLVTEKTGVALGLLQTTDSSNVKLYRNEAGAGNIPFQYYVGMDDGTGYFRKILEPNSPPQKLHKLIKFCSRKTFTLYVTKEISASEGDGLRLRVDAPDVRAIKVNIPELKDPRLAEKAWVLIYCPKPNVIGITIGVAEDDKVVEDYKGDTKFDQKQPGVEYPFMDN